MLGPRCDAGAAATVVTATPSHHRNPDSRPSLIPGPLDPGYPPEPEPGPVPGYCGYWGCVGDLLLRRLPWRLPR